jgi:hypothetical protein
MMIFGRIMTAAILFAAASTKAIPGLGSFESSQAPKMLPADKAPGVAMAKTFLLATANRRVQPGWAGSSGEVR